MDVHIKDMYGVGHNLEMCTMSCVSCCCVNSINSENVCSADRLYGSGCMLIPAVANSGHSSPSSADDSMQDALVQYCICGAFPCEQILLWDWMSGSPQSARVQLLG